MKQQDCILFLEDLRNASAVKQYNTFRIQRLDYSMERFRHDSGGILDNTNSSLLKITIRQDEDQSTRTFYERLISTDTFHFSVINEPGFDSQQTLTEYSSTEVFDGYIVDIEETFDSVEETSTSEQMLLTLKILIDKISYIGSGGVCELACM